MGKHSLPDSREGNSSTYSLSATLDKYEVKEISVAQAAKALGKRSRHLSRTSGSGERSNGNQ